MEYDVIIVGAGPAGLSSAIYLARAGFNVAIFDKDAPGGKILKTSEIENYPGFAKINGPDLAIQLLEHALGFGTQYLYGEVIDILDEGEYKKVLLQDGNVFTSKAVIIATGTKEKLIGIPNERKFYGKGVSYCAICDGALYKNQLMVVVGGGNSALNEAIYLTRFATKVIVVHRREEFKSDPKTIQKVMNNEKIELKLNYVVKDIMGEDKVSGIIIQNVLTNEEEKIETKIIFPFIGLSPESQFVKNPLLKDENGYLKIDVNMKTMINGIYAAGDVTTKSLRQIVTACNDGAIAANEVIKYLEAL